MELSNGVILLRKRLCSGEVSTTDNTKSVWRPGSTFMAHKLNNFWTKLNRIKAKNNEISDMLRAILH